MPRTTFRPPVDLDQGELFNAEMHGQPASASGMAIFTRVSFTMNSEIVDAMHEASSGRGRAAEQICLCLFQDRGSRRPPSAGATTTAFASDAPEDGRCRGFRPATAIQTAGELSRSLVTSTFKSAKITAVSGHTQSHGHLGHPEESCVPTRSARRRTGPGGAGERGDHGAAIPGDPSTRSIRVTAGGSSWPCAANIDEFSGLFYAATPSLE